MNSHYGGRSTEPNPDLQTTTLWYHPTQQHTDQVMGDARYGGRTPTYVIWNLLERYTRPGDLVVDPFCGGGTTLDVADSMDRRSRGFDLAAHAGRATGAGGLVAGRSGPGSERGDGARSNRVENGDARNLPIEDGVCEFVFMDPPYSTHLEYSDDERCIGKLSAFDDAYFEAMGQAFAEAERILRPGGHLAIYVSDSYENRRGDKVFCSIGSEFYCMLRARMRPVDHVAVTRGNAKLEDREHHEAALEHNYYLRGFNHLLIFQKP
ncbi:MAG: DNA methyltransferase [Planctomycetota bacterium]|nr:DNA methyltransferase [Planctomycetota bacterium]